MPKIVLSTEINAKIDICFDLSRSIDLHKISTAKTREEAIEGKTSGLIELDEFVTWEANHFGLMQKLTTKITAYQKPYYFVDEQLKGAFKSFRHEHQFQQHGEITIMKDVFEFYSPFGFFGQIFNGLILTNYMRKLLIERNIVIKDFAETDQWKLVLNTNLY